MSDDDTVLAFMKMGVDLDTEFEERQKKVLLAQITSPRVTPLTPSQEKLLSYRLPVRLFYLHNAKKVPLGRAHM